MLFRNEVKVKHSYYFKGTYYFRKVIRYKHIVNRPKNKDYMLRISLKKLLGNLYYVLEKNNIELDKLTTYLNTRLSIYLRHRGQMEINDILDYIYVLAEDYKKNAVIENTALEVRRIEALEYYDENGYHAGHTIQALSKKYKEIITQYDRLTIDTQKTVQLGQEIVKRSNITKEQLLEVPPEKIQIFYEMLIKAEKEILESDIRLYIDRNLSQFTPLITDLTKSHNEKKEEAFYCYLEIVRNNEPLPKYIDYIKSMKQNNTSIAFNQVDKDKLMLDIMSALQEQQKDKSTAVQTDIDYMFDQFLKYKNYTADREKNCKNALKLFKEYLLGNGFDCEPLHFTELTIEHIFKLEKLLCEAMPRTKGKEFDGLSLFDLINLRRARNAARYAVNTMTDIESFIKQFWKYLSKAHKNLKLDKDLFEMFNPSSKLSEIKYDNNEEDPDIRAFKDSEINELVDFAYDDKELKKILRDQPRNFYMFMFALLCGTRHEEALLLTMDNLKVYNSKGKRYYYFYLNEDKPFQHLKNQNAHRNIPITDLMVDLGFINYLHLRKKRGKETVFDFPASGGTAVGSFFKRKILRLFPDHADTRENRNFKVQEYFIQFRSFRKNFSDILFSQTRNEFDTTMNKQRVIGHDNGTTGSYLGRANPMEIYHILNDINFEEDFYSLESVKNFIKKYYKEIKRDIDWIEEVDGEWKIKSKVKRKRGRKV